MTNCNGFDAVRDFVVALCRQTPGGVARITNKEAGDAAGITGQAAGKHLQFLVMSGVLTMLRRSVYSVTHENSPLETEFPKQEVSERFPKGFNRVSIETQMKPAPPPQNAPEVSLEFQNGFKSVSKPRKDKTKEKEKENEQEMREEIFAFGVSVGDGILKSGLPAFADEIDQYIDVTNSKIQEVRRIVETIFPTKCRDWSKTLTDRIVFGMVYALNGFDYRTLKQKSIDAVGDAKQYRLFEDSCRQHDVPWRRNENSHCPDPWRKVAGHVKFWLGEAGVTWTPTESETKEQIKARGAKARERQRQLQNMPQLPGMESPPVTESAPVHVSKTNRDNVSENTPINVREWRDALKELCPRIRVPPALVKQE